MKRMIAIVTISVACGFVAYHLLTFENKNDVRTTVETAAVLPSRISQINQKAVSNEASSVQSAVNLTPSSDDRDNFEAINRVSEQAEKVLKATNFLPTDLNNEAYIEFDLDTLNQLEQGDSFDLSIPQTAETFSAEVTNVVLASNGDKSIFGQVIGAKGQFHTTVMTIGKDAIYGQFTAPSGNYVFESKGKHGWLAAKRDLYKNHMEHQVTEQPPTTSNNGEDPFAVKPQDIEL